MKRAINMNRYTRMISELVVATLAALLFLVAAYRVEAAEPLAAATDFVGRFAESAQSLAAARGVPAAAREDGLRVLLLAHIDLNAISRLVVGRDGLSASEDDLAAYRLAFDEFAMRTLVRHLTNYRGEKIDVTGAEAIPGGDLWVKSRIRRDRSAIVALDWRVRPADGGFKILDVVVSGLSLVATYRNEFATLIRKNGGLAGLTTILKERTAAM